MGKEVAIATPQQASVPSFTMSEMERIALAIAKGRLFGSDDPNAVLTLCMVAQAEGKHPAQVMQDYDIIKGKPAKKAQAMLKDFLTAGGRVTWNRLDDECADATFSHPTGGEVTINWTMARAQKAQLANGDNWKKYPRAMLRSRVVSEGVRTVFPGATSGMYVPEEVADFGGDNTPVDTPPTPEPKRARDLKSEAPKQIEAKPDAKRAKAEDWLAWLREEVDAAGGEIEAVRAIFADGQPTLTKLEKEYPDLYAEAMQLAPTPEQPGFNLADEIEKGADEHPGKAKAEELIAQINAANAVMDITSILARNEADIQSMPDDWGVKIEVAADRRRKAIEAARTKEAAK